MITSDGKFIREMVKHENTPVRWSVMGIVDDSDNLRAEQLEWIVAEVVRRLRAETACGCQSSAKPRSGRGDGTHRTAGDNVHALAIGLKELPQSGVSRARDGHTRSERRTARSGASPFSEREITMRIAIVGTVTLNRCSCEFGRRPAETR